LEQLKNEIRLHNAMTGEQEARQEFNMFVQLSEYFPLILLFLHFVVSKWNIFQ
jgi:hypothetical protein